MLGGSIDHFTPQEGGSGYVIELPEAIASAVADLIANPPTQEAVAANADQFSWEGNAQALAEFDAFAAALGLLRRLGLAGVVGDALVSELREVGLDIGPRGLADGTTICGDHAKPISSPFRRLERASNGW